MKERGQEAVGPPVEAELQQLPARAVGEPARLAQEKDSGVQGAPSVEVAEEGHQARTHLQARPHLLIRRRKRILKGTLRSGMN